MDVVKSLLTQKPGLKLSENEIGVIGAFRHQVLKIRLALRLENLYNVSVGGVEDFQVLTSLSLVCYCTVCNAWYVHCAYCTPGPGNEGHNHQHSLNCKGSCFGEIGKTCIIIFFIIYFIIIIYLTKLALLLRELWVYMEMRGAVLHDIVCTC